jgi:hypothetical protein
LSDRPIGAELCNTLITEAPATIPELHTLRMHFAEVERLLVLSGPRFAGPRRDAIDMHNRAVRRIKGIIDERKRRQALEDEPQLMEIGV